MPMIDVYAAAGTFGDPRALAQKLASELMAIEQVPDIPMFRQNTAAFIHDLPAANLSKLDGDWLGLGRNPAAGVSTSRTPDSPPAGGGVLARGLKEG